VYLRLEKDLWQSTYRTIARPWVCSHARRKGRKEGREEERKEGRKTCYKE
jgi:hypothetical protein